MIDLTKKKTVYEENGYMSRKHYLISLSNDYGIEKSVVFELASLLGASEDFDGLVNALDDYCLYEGLE